MSTKVTKTHRNATGTGGWIEGYETTQVPMTKLTSKSTGKSITMPGHSDDYTGQEIKQRIAACYDKDYKRTFCGMKDADLKNDFE